MKRSKPIDYALRVADIEPFYYLLAVEIAVLVWAWSGKWRIGLLAPKWRTVGLAAGYSMLIEPAQLVSFRGLFEFDDVMHNALGTAVGVLLVLGMRRVKKRS